MLTFTIVSDISDIRKMRGNIFDIKKFAVHDGPGIRTTVFLTGCPLNCPWCHNPESNIRSGSAGMSRSVSVEEVFKEIDKDRPFYDESGGGVTFSGGEPLFQHDFLIELMDRCKRSGIHTTIDTTGYTSRGKIKETAEFTDLYLYDLKIVDRQKHIEFTGVDNIEILSNIRVLTELGKEVIIRIPVIPGYNDSVDDLRQSAEFIKKNDSILRVDLLPYHRMGLSKYNKLGLEFRMNKITPPSNEKMEEIKKLFEDFDLYVVIGG